MKKVWQKIKEFHMPENLVAVFSVIALLAILLPILRLAMFTTPWYDDYSYTYFTKSFMAQDGIWPGIVNGAWYTTRTWWYCWQGTYSSIFFMGLSPLVFGEEYYWMGVMAIILFFVFASMLLVKVVCKNVLKAKWSTQLMVSSLVTAALVEFIYNSQQGLFWYNSAVHYTFMHGVFFVFIAVLVKMFYAKKAWQRAGWMLLETLLAVVCAGSNFVSALQGFLSLLIAIMLMILYKKRAALYCLLPTVIYAFGLYKSLGAPGNSVRGAYYQGYGVVESVFYSFVAAFKNFWELTGFRFFFVLALFLLLIWNAVKEMKFEFRFPGLVTFFSVCFYATGFTSSLYGMGTEGLARTWVVIKFTLFLLMFVNAAYWLGWSMKQWRKRKGKIGEAKQWVWYYALVATGILLCFLLTEGQARDFSTFGAYYYVHTGEAANHNTEYMQRVETIKNGGANVEVKPIFWKPWFLFKGELSTNPTAEANVEMAKWYGKESITLIIEDETN
ncbi:MAG: hypothetical protein IJY10_00325 [Lachnospiraceae bacterium]|nr:hypothetical protein [Lachnospiraceae bacterium]